MAKETVGRMVNLTPKAVPLIEGFNDPLGHIAEVAMLESEGQLSR
jgi:hypothetical protein